MRDEDSTAPILKQATLEGRLPPRFSRSRTCVVELISFTAATLLLCAAALKLVSLPAATSGPDFGRLLAILEASAEAMLGLWLLGATTVAIRVAAIVYSVFAAVSLHHAIAGDASCGCFGHVSVPPALTATVDGLYALGLFWSLTAQSSSRSSARPRLRISLAGVAICIALSLALIRPIRLVGTASQVIDPAAWIGRPPPLAEELGLSLDGDWLVAFYHHDCPRCLSAVSVLMALTDDPSADRVLFVELPPYGNSLLTGVSPTVRRMQRRIRDGSGWQMETPLIVRLDGGLVHEVVQGSDAVLWCAQRRNRHHADNR